MKSGITPGLFSFILLLACSDRTGQADTTTSNNPQDPYIEKGRMITAETFRVLSTQLMQAMAEGGIQNAAQYCNLAAYPLVDSLSEAHGAEIKRTSHKVRNQDNQPGSREARVITEYLADKANRKPLVPKVEFVHDKVHFYAPIILAENCLACHGQVGKDIKAEDYAVIKSLYPGDQAIGFYTGDLRGIWSVTFDK